MTGYSLREVFSPGAVRAFRLAEELVARVASHADSCGREIRCHELARAVACHFRVLGVDRRVVDGLLWSVEHTWIVLPGTIDHALLDVYVPGRLPQVQLIHRHQDVSRGYVPGLGRTDVRWSVVDDLAREMTPTRSAVRASVDCAADREEG